MGVQFLVKNGEIFSSNSNQFKAYSPSYKALQEENQTGEFLRNLLFANHSNYIKNYNDIEKYFVLCLKGGMPS